jgi:hypothetical protein
MRGRPRRRVALVLTVRANGGAGDPTVPVPEGEINAYADTVGEIVAATEPDVVAVENEENSSLFYEGSPVDYERQLRAACEVVHGAGVPCTNGGLVGSMVAYLVWYDHLHGGDAEAACDYAQRVFDAERRANLCRYGSVEQVQGELRATVDEGQALLGVYQRAGADGLVDYVNFHWYSLDPAGVADPSALTESIAYLEAVTGLPAMTNEIGQHETSPQTVTDFLTTGECEGLPFIVWFSKDNPGSRARALYDPLGELRPNGEAFADYMNGRPPGCA